MDEHNCRTLLSDVTTVKLLIPVNYDMQGDQDCSNFGKFHPKSSKWSKTITRLNSVKSRIEPSYTKIEPDHLNEFMTLIE